ncbi:MAG: NADH-quinone oxidoreductase subunit N [Chloroflexales bacterium]
MFQITDVPRILPEILLLVLALLVLGSDIFERWANTSAARLERVRASAQLTAIGLGLIFLIALVQSGYVYKLPEVAPTNFFTNILRNLQSGGPGQRPIVGAFATDDLTMISRLIFIGAAFITSLLCLDYHPNSNPAEFYALIIFSTMGMCLMAGATELVLIFLGVEMTSIPLYVLAGYFHSQARSSEAGMKYFLFGAMSSALMLYGMSMAYGIAANAAGGNGVANDLTQLARIAELSRPGGPLLTLSMVLILAGAGYKVAVVPFHGWSPDVYQGAPTPITAFISTASKAAGFILLFRLLTTAFPGLAGSAAFGANMGGWTSMLAILALLTLIVGNLAALPQMNAKRLLAYSSIAQAGFVLLSMVAWAASQQFDREQGTVALIYYLVIYTLTNLGAFGALAAISLAVGGDDVSDLNGLARRNLPLAVLFAICVLSLAGVPPLAGFFAKFYVFMVAWQTGAWSLTIIALFTTIISLYYYLRLLKAMFITAPVSEEPLPAPAGIMSALGIAVAGIVLLGIFPNLILGIISRVQTVAGVGM